MALTHSAAAAKPESAESRAGQLAQNAAAETIAFNISAAPLAEALTKLGEQSGLTIIVETDVSKGVTANSLSGRYTPDEALKRLLEPAGLKAEYLDSKTVAVRRAKGSSHESDTTRAGQQATVLRLAQNDQPVPTGGGSTSVEQRDRIEEIVTTGTRIARRDFVSTSPLVTANQAALESSGQVNVEASLNQMPQFTPGQNASTVGLGGVGRATLDLRGLGAFRNLVLLDGRRMQPSDGSNVVDVNNIPLAILDSVEVISGGASAVYGSDAISGVVNFKMKKNFEGLQLDAQTGGSFEGDAGTYDVSLTAGGNFADDRGNAVVSIGYFNRDRVNQFEREFYRYGIGNGFMASGSYLASATNLPSQAAIDTVFGAYGVAPGAVPTTRNLSFNPDGTLFTNVGGVNFRQPIANAADPAQSPFEYLRFNGNVQNRLFELDMIVPQERYSLFGRLNYDVAPAINVYVQGQFVNSELSNRVTASISVAPWSLRVPTTNPFIPADLATILASRPNPTAPFGFQRYHYRDTGVRQWDYEFNTYQLLVGATGNLGVKDWTYDIYASRGHANTHETAFNQALVDRMQTLLNAPDGGASLCQGGWNPFGDTTASDSCRAYMSGRLHTSTDVSQDIVEATVQGALFQLPADTMRFSAGVSYRKNEYETDPDSQFARHNVAALPGGIYTQGSTNVKEIYGELLIPLLADVPLVQALELNLGYRYSDYNIAGSVDTYKADASWRVNRSFLFRGGHQRAIRAPNNQELFLSDTGTAATLGFASQSSGDPCDVAGVARSAGSPTRAQVEALCVQQGINPALLGSYTFPSPVATALNRGNLDLEPEEADTFTFGLVWESQLESELLSQLTASIDYYKIDLDKAISTVAGQTSLNKCFNLDGSNPSYDPNNTFCRNILRDPATGSISTLLQPYENLGGYKTSGIDFQINWGFELGAIGLKDEWGRVSLSTVVNHLESFEIQQLPNAPFQDYAGTVTVATAGTPVLPEWKGLTTLGYGIGPADFGIRWRYLDRMKDVSSVTNPARPSPGVPSFSYFDLTGRYAINDAMEIRAGVNNLLDKEPPRIAGLPGATNPGVYDVIGRAYYVAVRAQF